MKITQEKKPSNNSKKLVKRNKKGQLLPGSVLNPEGMKTGTRQFSTLMDEAVEEIAKLNKISEGEVWQILIKIGYSEAKGGNYLFYKDILDRYFGKAKDIFGGDKDNPLVFQIIGMEIVKDGKVKNKVQNKDRQADSSE